MDADLTFRGSVRNLLSKRAVTFRPAETGREPSDRLSQLGSQTKGRPFETQTGRGGYKGRRRWKEERYRDHDTFCPYSVGERGPTPGSLKRQDKTNPCNIRIGKEGMLVLLWCASLGGNKSYYLSSRSPKADPLDSSPKKLCYYGVVL